METLLERIRRAELEPLRSYFPAGCRVLELGGGSGFQASILSFWGCDVRSIDVATRPDPHHQRYGRQYFPVATYDGCNIPFADASFDVVYSSHMLYHAVALDAMLAETSRVLRPGGVAVHVLPSASWRFWTTLAHYPNLVKKLLTRPRPVYDSSTDASQPSGPQVSDSALRPSHARTSSQPHAGLRRARLLLTVRPLGPSSDVFGEWFSFGKRRWRSSFVAAGFPDVKVRRGPLFYTGHLMTPGLSFGLRASMAFALGPASFAWTMRR
jgi:SAM-dependent methyltransferase